MVSCCNMLQRLKSRHLQYICCPLSPNSGVPQVCTFSCGVCQAGQAHKGALCIGGLCASADLISLNKSTAGTLAGASGHALEKILHKRQGSGRGHRQQQRSSVRLAVMMRCSHLSGYLFCTCKLKKYPHDQAINSFLPQLPQAFNTDGICGAPAGMLDDEEQQNDSRQAGEQLSKIYLLQAWMLKVKCCTHWQSVCHV